MGQWMTAPEAFGFLVLGAALLAALLPIAVWPRPLPRAGATLAVLGLLIAACALRILRLKTGAAAADLDPDFAAARNGESLALAAVPLALALLRHERATRAGGLAFGLFGAWLLASWLMPGGESWAAPMQREDRFAAAQVPGLARLAGHGDLASGRWLWFAGATLAALPLLQLVPRRARARVLSGEDEAGLTLLLAGLGLSSAALGVFFWHQEDWSDRVFARSFLEAAAVAAPLLALTHGRIISATWVRLGLAGLNALLALWLGSGVLGADFADGRATLGDSLPSFLVFVLLALSIPVLALHGAAAAGLACARWCAGLLRRRSAAT